jgi:hypothetical protein
VNRPIMMKLSALMSRLLYLESMDEQYGPNRGRAYEHEAITWVIGELADTYPAEIAEAEIVAEDRDRRRAEKQHGG